MLKTSNLILNNCKPTGWTSQFGLSVIQCFDPKDKRKTAPKFTRYSTGFTTSELKQYTDKHLNCYRTINTFRTKNRREYNLAGLNALFVDIDCEKYGVSKDKLIDLLPCIMIDAGLFYQDKLINATYEIDSGHGIYLIIVFKQQVIVNKKVIVNLWRKLEDTLVNKLNTAMYKTLKVKPCDTSATDPARILRIPGTYNNKDPKHPLPCYVISNNKQTYDMFKLCDEILEPAPWTTANKRKKKQKVENPKKYKISVDVYKNATYLNIKRKADIEKLVAMRNHEMNGMREITLFIYSTVLVPLLMDINKVMDAINDLNNSFSEPLPKREIRVLEHEIKYIDIDKYYKYTNARIINDLQISEDEQGQLSTIISKKEKYLRNNTRRQLISKTKGAKYKRKQRNKQIRELHGKGFKVSEIAKKLGITRPTVYSVIKAN